MKTNWQARANGIKAKKILTVVILLCWTLAGGMAYQVFVL
jgi:hypothetical protein